jgi:hypothetical protein
MSRLTCARKPHLLVKPSVPIENSICDAERLLPTQQALSEYLRRRNRFLAGRSACHVFVSRTGNRLDKSQVHSIFNALSRQTGLREPSASRGPRLHDFRHSSGNRTIPATGGQRVYFLENRGVVGTSLAE